MVDYLWRSRVARIAAGLLVAMELTLLAEIPLLLLGMEMELELELGLELSLGLA